MPRTKTAKRAASRHSSSALALTHRMEKDFITTPAKLAAQLNKEISALKQKENKIKTAWHKSKVEVKKWDARIKAAAKMNTASGKKQLKKAKKAHWQVAKDHAMLSEELHATSHMLATIASKQAKFVALAKILSQFDKDWAKRAKKSKMTKAGSKTRSKSRKKLDSHHPSSAAEAETQRMEAMMMGEDVKSDENIAS